MKMKENGIVELDVDDRYLFTGVDFYVGAESLGELYWQAAAELEVALAQEFDQLERAQEDGATLAEALDDSYLHNVYSTEL